MFNYCACGFIFYIEVNHIPLTVFEDIAQKMMKTIYRF